LRVLIDECLPSVLARWLKGHEFKTVQETGWKGIQNGELLGRAEGVFDLILTADRSVQYEQNLSRHRISILVLPSNRLGVLRRMLPEIQASLDLFAAGASPQYMEIPWRAV
jgi:hypothetical protein